MSEIQNNKELQKNEIKYKEARAKMVNAIDVSDYDEAILMFKSLGDYRDSYELIGTCRKRKEKMIQDNNESNRLYNSKYQEIKYGGIKAKASTIILIVIGVAWLAFIAAALLGLFSGSSTPTM